MEGQGKVIVRMRVPADGIVVERIHRGVVSPPEVWLALAAIRRQIDHLHGHAAQGTVLCVLLPVKQVVLVLVLPTEHEAHEIVVTGGAHPPDTGHLVRRHVEVTEQHRGARIDGLVRLGAVRVDGPLRLTLAANAQVDKVPQVQVHGLAVTGGGLQHEGQLRLTGNNGRIILIQHLNGDDCWQRAQPPVINRELKTVRAGIIGVRQVAYGGALSQQGAVLRRRHNGKAQRVAVGVLPLQGRVHRLVLPGFITGREGQRWCVGCTIDHGHIKLLAVKAAAPITHLHAEAFHAHMVGGPLDLARGAVDAGPGGAFQQAVCQGVAIGVGGVDVVIIELAQVRRVQRRGDDNGRVIKIAHGDDKELGITGASDIGYLHVHSDITAIGGLGRPANQAADGVHPHAVGGGEQAIAHQVAQVRVGGAHVVAVFLVYMRGGAGIGNNLRRLVKLMHADGVGLGVSQPFRVGHLQRYQGH